MKDQNKKMYNNQKFLTIILIAKYYCSIFSLFFRSTNTTKKVIKVFAKEKRVENTSDQKMKEIKILKKQISKEQMLHMISLAWNNLMI